MTIHKAYKFRLYPNNQQKEIINKTFGCTRFIYNYYLDMKQKEYKNNKTSKSAYECIKDITTLYTERPYLKEVDSLSLRCTIFDLDNAYKGFYKGIRNYPNFKSKYDKNSYRTNMITSTYKGKKHENIILDLQNRTITLPKLKEIRIRGYRNLKNINGRIINATIYKEAGKYYVSICVEEYITIPSIIPTKIVGVDLGIKDLVIMSDGTTLKNKKYIEKYERKIKGLNRWLARSKAGSKNRYKIKLKLQTVYKKLRNARKYLLHSISNKLIKENDIIAIESLKINEMVQNKNLSKKIYDASWYELIRQLEYKTKWKGKKLYKIDTYYASSQICSRCGYQNSDVKDLSVREWECPKCTNQNNRDINASVNIMFEGLKLYMKKVLNELQVI